MKRLFDFLVAAIGGIVLLPLMLLIAVAVRLSSPGPVLYVQDRVGRNGKLFRCMKFRTMKVGADRHGSVTTGTDSRMTALGRFLRRIKLDELPQLWNVLLGRMSFVGPRPDVPGYADRLEGEERIILSVRPGITGPATLAFRNEEGLLAAQDDPVVYNDTVLYPAKVRLNMEYVRTRTFWRDIGYIFVTVIPPLDRWLKLVPRDGGR
jgi:lipopolysaccharide/colanic/teichoic acid biosynthesis glycosyltransferase